MEIPQIFHTQLKLGVFKNLVFNDKMSLVRRKPVFALCEQQRRRSACASAQSDQHFVIRCLDSITPLVDYFRNFKTLASL